MPSPHKRRPTHRHKKAEPIDIIPVMTENKAWYESKTAWGLLMVVIPIILGKFGLSIDTDGFQPALRTLVTDVREVVGSALVLWGTVSKKRAPLTFTSPSPSKLPILFLLACLCLFPSCAGTFEAQAAPMLGSARGVVGGRTVAGIEFPPVFLPVGIGAGVWLVRSPKPELTDAQIEAIDAEFIKAQQSGK